MSLFDTGIRPAVDAYLQAKSEEVRDYGEYFSASSAGYCMRKVIFERLGVPHVKDDARKTRVFEVGHIFHAWMQNITKNAGLSVASEVELQDKNLMVRGHFDDLILVEEPERTIGRPGSVMVGYSPPQQHLILYDYKTVNSQAFSWAKKNGNAMSYYHKMQVATYLYMLRKRPTNVIRFDDFPGISLEDLTEARILKISKDDLRLSEQQLFWSDELEKEVVAYWTELNKLWKARKLPSCTCADHEGGFLAKEKYNGFFYEGEPCSLAWLTKCKSEGLLKEVTA